MAAPKSRLGRGLGGLIANAVPAAKAAADAKPAVHAPSAAPHAAAPAPATPGFLEVPVHFIEPSPSQARKEISPEHLNELAESIRS
ncbi:MAG TPA: chromosome partitioning protein ParB, partial [Opitutaceae bacterium]|nr:chromosome partitioning protein ParB [Opitutaceae bacterium]